MTLAYRIVRAGGVTLAELNREAPTLEQLPTRVIQAVKAGELTAEQAQLVLQRATPAPFAPPPGRRARRNIEEPPAAPSGRPNWTSVTILDHRRWGTMTGRLETTRVGRHRPRPRDPVREPVAEQLAAGIVQRGVGEDPA